MHGINMVKIEGEIDNSVITVDDLRFFLQQLVHYPHTKSVKMQVILIILNYPDICRILSLRDAFTETDYTLGHKKSHNNFKFKRIEIQNIFLIITESNQESISLGKSNLFGN